MIEAIILTMSILIQILILNCWFKLTLYFITDLKIIELTVINDGCS